MSPGSTHGGPPAARGGGRAGPVNVICMKWGTAFGPEWVNRLYAGVRRNLSLPHRFVCLTDDPSGLRRGIEHFPLIDVVVPAGEPDLRWRKLAVFNERVYDLEGTALFLDLDVVVVGSLDAFFEHPGRFLIIRDDDLALPKPLRWINPRRARRMRRVGNTSVFRFEVGAHPDILETYSRDPERAIRDQPNRRQQEFLTEELHRRGLIRYWPRGWCVSFKNHCVPLFARSYVADPVPPPGARLVIFAGGLKIPDALARRGSSWYRRIGPSAWLEEAWSA